MLNSNRQPPTANRRPVIPGNLGRWLGPSAIGRGLLLFGANVRPLTAPLAVWGLRRGSRVVVVDAVLGFDPYRLVREARFRGLPGQESLQQVRVSRAFTCHQLVRLVQESLPGELAGTKEALLLFLGPCSLFYDEQIPLAERRRLFQAMVAGLAPLRAQAVLCFLQSRLPPVVANQHFGRFLTALVDQVLELEVGLGGIQLRPRGRRLAPGWH